LAAGDPLLQDIEEVLISAPRLRRRVSELGKQITADYEGRDLCLVTVLRGGAFFLVDLARSIHLPVSIEFMAITSYGPQSQTGAVRITKDLDEGVSGRHLLIVEDIVDTGLTLSYIYRNLQRRAPASVAICVLLDRPYRRIADLPIAYRGFEIPDVFVVGYGLDWRQKHRNLPFIGVLKRSVYEAG
jgi:hypoxanthine phosphoribosyltransferase